MHEPLGDPTTGKVELKLSDGITRTLVFDFRALRVLEEITQLPFVEAARVKVTATTLRQLVYVGLYGDARRRKEEWTLDKVEELIDLAQIPHLTAAVSWALITALARLAEETKKLEGEILANAKNPLPDGAGAASCSSPKAQA